MMIAWPDGQAVLAGSDAADDLAVAQETMPTCLTRPPGSSPRVRNSLWKHSAMSPWTSPPAIQAWNALLNCWAPFAHRIHLSSQSGRLKRARHVAGTGGAGCPLARSWLRGWPQAMAILRVPEPT